MKNTRVLLRATIRTGCRWIAYYICVVCSVAVLLHFYELQAGRHSGRRQQTSLQYSLSSSRQPRSMSFLRSSSFNFSFSPLSSSFWFTLARTCCPHHISTEYFPQSPVPIMLDDNYDAWLVCICMRVYGSLDPSTVWWFPFLLLFKSSLSPSITYRLKKHHKHGWSPSTSDTRQCFVIYAAIVSDKIAPLPTAPRNSSGFEKAACIWLCSIALRSCDYGLPYSHSAAATDLQHKPQEKKAVWAGIERLLHGPRSAKHESTTTASTDTTVRLETNKARSRTTRVTCASNTLRSNEAIFDPIESVLKKEKVKAPAPGWSQLLTTLISLLTASTSTTTSHALHFSLHSLPSHLPSPLLLLLLLLGSPSEIQEFSLS